MKGVKSKCIVCGTLFPVSETTAVDIPNKFKYNFRVFCAYLNIPIAWNGTRDEKSEIYLWDSACGPFSFCLQCKSSVDTLYNFHKQKLSSQNEIRQIVSNFVSKIISTDTHTHSGSSNGTDTLYQIVAGRIRGVQQTIWDYYNPTVVLIDCRDNYNNVPSIVPKVEVDELDDSSDFVDDEWTPLPGPSVSTKEENIEIEESTQRTEPVVDNKIEESTLDTVPITFDDTQPIFSITEVKVARKRKSDQSTGEESTNDDSENIENDLISPDTTNVIEESTPEDPAPPPPTTSATDNSVDDTQPIPDSTEIPVVKKRKKSVKINEGTNGTEEETGTVVKTEEGQKKKKNRHRKFKVERDDDGIIHYGEWKIEELVRGKKFGCKQCGQTTTRLSTTIRHINAVHILKTGGHSRVTKDAHGVFHFKGWKFEKTEEGFKCQTCGRIKQKQQSMVNHLNEIHCNTKGNKFRCDKCRRSWSTEEKLTSHNCCPAPTTSSSTSSKTREIKNVQVGEGKYIYNGVWPYEKLENGGFSCSACEATKTSVDRMAAHIRERHIHPHKYSCDLCGYTVGNQGVMKQHRASHSDIRDYKCDTCSKCFKTASRLAAHRIGHRAERFECTVCNKTFQYQNGLGRHRRLTGHMSAGSSTVRAINYDCPKCERNMRTSKRLEAHLVKCNGHKAPVIPSPISFLPCTICGEIVNEKLLLHHLSSEHRITNGVAQPVVVERDEEEEEGIQYIIQEESQQQHFVTLPDGTFQIMDSYSDLADCIIILDEEPEEGQIGGPSTVEIWMDALGRPSLE